MHRVWAIAMRDSPSSVCATASAGPQGIGFTVPLCRVHHRELHRQGDERLWWTRFNIDPMPIALKFWYQTKGIPAAQRTGAR
jgi:hypothetical protein